MKGTSRVGREKLFLLVEEVKGQGMQNQGDWQENHKWPEVPLHSDQDWHALPGVWMEGDWVGGGSKGSWISIGRNPVERGRRNETNWITCMMPVCFWWTERPPPCCDCSVIYSLCPAIVIHSMLLVFTVATRTPSGVLPQPGITVAMARDGICSRKPVKGF